jgi:hypothetical protein
MALTSRSDISVKNGCFNGKPHADNEETKTKRRATDVFSQIPDFQHIYDQSPKISAAV